MTSNRGMWMARDVLAGLAADHWRVFHDVRPPGRSAATIGHVLIGPQGVFAVDSVSWEGPVEVRDGVLRHHGRRRRQAAAAAVAAADAIRDLVPWLDLTGAKPVLCLERSEPVFGWVGEVMVCSSENILTLLTSRPRVLDDREIARTAELLVQSLGSSGSAVRRSRSGRPRAGRSRPATSRPLRLFATLATVAALVTVVIQLDAPRHLGALGAETVEELRTPMESTGHTFTLAAGGGRPALDVTAVEPVLTRSATPGVRAGRGRQLVAVPLTIRNRGVRPWISQPGTSVEVSDSDDVLHRPLAGLTKVRAGRVMPAQVRVPAGRTMRRLVVFDVPVGTTVTQIRLTLGREAVETVRWSIG